MPETRTASQRLAPASDSVGAVTARAVRQIKSRAPWHTKMILKLAISQLPFPYRWLSKTGIFRQGEMDDPAYAYTVFRQHTSRVDLEPGFVLLELGPGDSLATAMIAAAHGASRTILVDQGEFAVANMDFYRGLERALRESGLEPPALGHASTPAEVLHLCNASYLTRGLKSLRSLPSASVDFAFSNAVLEHVRAVELPQVHRELCRVVRDGGHCSHAIDLRDHLGDGLNHLRFGRKRWESRLFAESGFYTNRLTYADHVDELRRAGFSIDHLSLTRWPTLPTPRSKLAKPFRCYTDDTLLVSGVEVLLTRAARPSSAANGGNDCDPAMDGRLGGSGPRANTAGEQGHQRDNRDRKLPQTLPEPPH
jgi:hypothetical protein